MHHPLRVRVAERTREVGEQRHSGRDAVTLGAPSALALLSKALALDVFHDEVEQPVGFTRGVDRDDVGMPQPGHRARLAQEALPRREGGSEVGGDDLDGHGPIQGTVASEQHLPHPAGAELSLDVVPFGHAVGLAEEPSPGAPPDETTRARERFGALMVLPEFVPRNGRGPEPTRDALEHWLEAAAPIMMPEERCIFTVQPPETPMRAPRCLQVRVLAAA